MNLRLGSNMKHALNFATSWQGWHTYSKHCKATQDAIRRLEARGLVETNEFNMFRKV